MNHILKIIIISSLLFNFGVGMLTPIYAIFVGEIGGDVLTASYSFALFTGSVGILTFIFGKVEDGLNKKKLYVIGAGLNVLAIGGYNFISEPLHLFIVQGILGITTAMIYPVFDTLFSTNLKKGKEAFEWSIWEGSTFVAIAASSVVGGIIVSTLGFGYLFMIMTSFAFMAFVNAIFITKHRKISSLFRASS